MTGQGFEFETLFGKAMNQSGAQIKKYTGVSVSLLVPLPRPPLRDSLSVQILSVQYGYRDPPASSGTDTETASVSVLL